ncbi:hypothetical protein [Armatimonas sp.]|uniref:hypothetical protein n=1 Tax=Armatimonas sp. TaxID=1872638 RepID=UPI0037514DB6
MNATCFFTELKHSDICLIAKEIGYTYHIISGEDSWDKIKLSNDKGDFLINSLHVRKPGSELSRLILATHNYVKYKDVDNEIKIMKIIENCVMAVGFVFDNRYEGIYLDLVFELMSDFNCVVFDGEDFYYNEK